MSSGRVTHKLGDLTTALATYNNELDSQRPQHNRRRNKINEDEEEHKFCFENFTWFGLQQQLREIMEDDELLKCAR